MMFAGAPSSFVSPAACGCLASWTGQAGSTLTVRSSNTNNVSPMWRWRGTSPALRAAGVNTLIWTADQANSHDRHVPIAVKADIAPPPMFPTTPTGGTILVMPAQEW